MGRSKWAACDLLAIGFNACKCHSLRPVQSAPSPHPWLHCLTRHDHFCSLRQACARLYRYRRVGTGPEAWLLPKVTGLLSRKGPEARCLKLQQGPRQQGLSSSDVLASRDLRKNGKMSLCRDPCIRRVEKRKTPKLTELQASSSCGCCSLFFP